MPPVVALLVDDACFFRENVYITYGKNRILTEYFVGKQRLLKYLPKV